ncbi:hypothetical protein L2E82_16042 [Cichorium intybus]|uniref:Uncharacterized protein n=1 Tax=Cichorium intybus TaxID=13427 RepID=A0ACB9F513_CICIN|nr:hypothetical protein L2E82_16042 [Cichorium intybus]
MLANSVQGLDESMQREDTLLGDYIGLLNSITVATPHLGSRGNKQVPFLFGVSALEKFTVSIIHWIFRRTRRHLFLTNNEDGKPPLLKRMLEDLGDLYFMSQLRSFHCRMTYTNVGYEQVGFLNNSKQLLQSHWSPVFSALPRHHPSVLVLIDEALCFYPLYIFTFILSTIWVMIGIAEHGYSVLLLTFFFLEVYLAGFLPYIGKALSFILLSWMYAYYCFEYKWNFSGLSFDKRLDFFESNWAFFPHFITIKKDDKNPQAGSSNAITLPYTTMTIASQR